MNYFVIMAVAERALRRNKTRSLLTTLGIIIGIAAVIAVGSVGAGANAMIRAQIDSMGSNMIWVFNGSSRGGGVRGGSGTQQSITVDDGRAIEDEIPHVEAVTPQINTTVQIVYREQNWRTTLRGTSEAYLDVRDCVMAHGAFFTESEVRSAARVCVIGQTVVDNLFDGEDPVGKVLRVGRSLFRVLGVFEKKGATAWGSDQDDIMIMPWTTVRQTIEKSQFDNVTQLSIAVDGPENFDNVKEEVAGLLRQRHRIAPGAEDDFRVTDPGEMARASTETTRIMTLLLTIIASISLVVGGIGIMNIMLVSVSERTREIGLRMAVGARGGDILMQFLIEAVMLATVGGLLGVAGGIFTATKLAGAYNWPLSVSIESVSLALGVSAGVGIAFGFFPALRASRLNPIDALRYE